MFAFPNRLRIFFIVVVVFTLALLAMPCGATPIKEKESILDMDWKTGAIRLPVAETMRLLLDEEDTDGDKKITKDDRTNDGSVNGDQVFDLKDVDGKPYRVESAYHLANLLQELALAKSRGLSVVTLHPETLMENPVDRISRSIRELYWDGLTRRVDEEFLPQIIKDTKRKSIDGYHYVYVPFSDREAGTYFKKVAEAHPEWKVKVRRLQENPEPRYVRELDGRHGILTLAMTGQGEAMHGVPFVVPGGRFNEMYGWDSYFESLGLLVDGRVDLAKAMVDNFVYQINHYGKILNANRTYYLTRSQPPFLSSMALAVYKAMPGTGEEKTAWLKTVALAAIQEYEQVWTSTPRLTENGLSRYYGSGIGPCPEVEPGHYDHIVKPYANKEGVSENEYLQGYLTGKYTNDELASFFVHDRAVRESGHDTTYRFDNRTADFNPVDLNSLLYKIETDMEKMIREVFAGVLLREDGRKETANVWRQRAEQRKETMNRLMWDQERGAFYDYDFVRGVRSGYVSATCLYPLWAGLATPEQAEMSVKNLLPFLEKPGGIAGSTEQARGPITEDRPLRQWDYPYGWAPHQMLVWRGLRNYGYDKDADRLAYRWLYMIAKNGSDYNGTVPEKYDVVQRTHQVFAEYGNVGIKFEHITREGFGWMNASFQVGLKMLDKQLLEKLKNMTPPKEVFEGK